MDETNTFIVNVVFKPYGPVFYIYLYFKILNMLLQMYTLEKNNNSPSCILCTLMPSNNTPFYTHVHSYVIWRFHSLKLRRHSHLSQNFNHWMSMRLNHSNGIVCLWEMKSIKSDRAWSNGDLSNAYLAQIGTLSIDNIHLWLRRRGFILLIVVQSIKMLVLVSCKWQAWRRSYFIKVKVKLKVKVTS